MGGAISLRRIGTEMVAVGIPDTLLLIEDGLREQSIYSRVSSLYQNFLIEYPLCSDVRGGEGQPVKNSRHPRSLAPPLPSSFARSIQTHLPPPSAPGNNAFWRPHVSATMPTGRPTGENVPPAVRPPAFEETVECIEIRAQQRFVPALGIVLSLIAFTASDGFGSESRTF